MKHSEAIMLASDLAMNMTTLQDTAISKFNDEFSSTTTDNEQTARQSDMHNAMSQFVIVSSLHSTYKRQYDEVKDKLDSSAAALGLDPQIDDGDSRMLFQNHLFSFTKRRNKESHNTAIKDFMIELNKLGVEKDTIQKAFDSATKPKKGSVYYDVTLVS